MASLIPDLKNFIVGLEIKDGAGVTQSTWRKIGGMINFLGHRVHQEKCFYANGSYGLFNAYLPMQAVDGLAFFEYDAEIFNVWVFSMKAGTSGITELDLKVKPKLSGAFTSIFTTTPKIAPSSGDNKFFEIGDVATGITAPVLNTMTGVYNVNKGDAVRFDIISAMDNAENCGIVIHFRPR